jgi:amino acid transporter
MAAQAGWWTLPAIAILAVPFIISSFIFRLLGRHFPHAGASYHWSARVIGKGVSRYQAWILILAYFFSIPPIAIPAGTYTLALLFPGYHVSPEVQMAVTLFWILFAAVPLLLGGRPTVILTQIFFSVEIVALSILGIVGVLRWHRLAVPIHFGAPPKGGIMIVAVVAATILDGWEIDSYAAEESQRPREYSGVGGIIGAFSALAFYVILYPLMLGETPLHSLANSTDPLAVWSHRLIPGAQWAILIPVLLSTAGGLWLTSFILSRALFAMGREHLIPASFARLNRHHVPYIAIITSLGLAGVVVAIQLFVSSLSSFFTLVLSCAGFFLMAEFFLDSVTAVVFLTVGHKRSDDVEFGGHSHGLLLVGALFSSVIMGALIVAFLVYGPKAISGGIDEIAFSLLGLGLIFVRWTKSYHSSIYRFVGLNVPAPPEVEV